MMCRFNAKDKPFKLSDVGGMYSADGEAAFYSYRLASRHTADWQRSSLAKPPSYDHGGNSAEQPGECQQTRDGWLPTPRIW